MRLIGYLRVSTTEQELQNCQAEILRFANEKRLVPVEWVEETVSGAVPWKDRQLGRILQELRPGDLVITPEISRLARSLGQIIQIIEHCSLVGTMEDASVQLWIRKYIRFDHMVFYDRDHGEVCS